MNQEVNQEPTADSAVDEPVTAMKNGSSGGAARAGRTDRRGTRLRGTELHLSHAAGIYILFMLAIYWPVFFGQRFFWEDIFIQEYPIREFCFYMVRWVHALPFWNPYSWAWSPLLADAQSGFWYPTNLLQVAITWLFAPNAIHLPVIVPETMTLLHMPLGALGMFVLSKKEFRLSGIAALVAGLCWGFGVQMAAVQNHSMFVIQLSLLPWETVLLMRSWKSWRSAIWLGLLFGISFFAGQPQAFFYIAIFFGAFTLAESMRVWHGTHTSGPAIRPFGLVGLALVIAVGVSAIQLLPTSELVGLSARQHLSFEEASYGGLEPDQAINFFVPKFFGEYPGFTIPKSPTVNDHFSYWEASFYWGAVAEVFAFFGVVSGWDERRSGNPQTRYLFFFVLFSVLCVAYGTGEGLYFQWPFWRFLPFFSHLRAPNRMVWFVWFVGTILTAIGLDTMIRKWDKIRRYRTLFLWTAGLFVFLNILAITGIFDRAYHVIRPAYDVRTGLWPLLLPGLIVSVLSLLFFVAVIRHSVAPETALLLAAILIAVDLYYNDFTWHRNTLNPETLVQQAPGIRAIQQFHLADNGNHSKLLILGPDSTLQRDGGLGMFLRVPVEYAFDSSRLLALNPLLLDRIIPPIRDSSVGWKSPESTPRSCGEAIQFPYHIHYRLLDSITSGR